MVCLFVSNFAFTQVQRLVRWHPHCRFQPGPLPLRKGNNAVTGFHHHWLSLFGIIRPPLGPSGLTIAKLRPPCPCFP